MFPVRAVHCRLRLILPALLLTSTLVATLVLTLTTALPVSADPEAPAGQLTTVGAAQISALQMEKATRTPAQRKMSSSLVMALKHQRQDPIFAALPDYQTLAPDADGRMLVDIDLAGPESLKPVVKTLTQMSAEIVYLSAESRTVRALMPLDQTEALAGMRNVAGVRAADQAVTNATGGGSGMLAPGRVDVSEGDVTHQADLARQQFGVTGAGQKICVLSNGVDSLADAQATGDLPPEVHVLSGQEGFGDEGTAMLEIVHDLAPGAELGFATAFLGYESFAQNILRLKAAGCTIIVDDVIYFVESPFQDNLIAHSVITVTNAGALYFSSANNDGNVTSDRSGTWEGDFHANGTIGGFPPGELHDFGDGGQSNPLLGATTRAMLHWTDPFDASGNDYDLYVLNNALTSVIASSTDIQDGAGTPFEFIFANCDPGDRIVVLRNPGAENRMINVLAFRTRLSIATTGATRGHSAAPLAYSVAAVPAHEAHGGGGPTGPYPNPFTVANQVEFFSADGLRRIFFGPDGKLLPGAPAGDYSATGGVVRQKPDIAAADGVQTSAPGFNPFFGTSAAAPHAAAIGGLLKEAFPISSTAEIRDLLQVTALDIMAPGVDRDSGYGIVMPVAALTRGGAQPRATLVNAGKTASQVRGNNDAYLDPNETWQLTIPISNAGIVSAEMVSATLSAVTPGVVVLAATSTYSDVAAGAARENDTPFVFRLLPEVDCGERLAFTLTTYYSDTQAHISELGYTLATGQISSTLLTFSYSGPVVPIPDYDGSPPITATAPITVTGVPGSVGRLIFKIDGTECTTAPGAATVGVDHTYVQDLVFDLRAPDGTVVNVIDGAGEDGVNFCQTVLDDRATKLIQTVPGQAAPFTGRYQPHEPLAHFETVAANGVWQLLVTDHGWDDTGHLRAFSLQIAPNVCRAFEPADLFMPLLMDQDAD
ncbi:MAG: S8 family serine peptidase [Anaerolineales bacterium]|nr:S8 family serine peptidase [Anaerolineales bacterium]